MIFPQGDCPSATRHIRPQPIVWMMAGYRVSPSGGAGSLYSRMKKYLGNIWGRKASSGGRRHSTRSVSELFQTALHFG